MAGEEEEGEEGEEGEGEGKDDAFVVVEEEEEDFNDVEELLVQAALDSSPKGFPTAGVSAVSASMVRTDEKEDRPLWLSPRACSLCLPSQAAGSLAMPGMSPASVSIDLHSVPTSAQAPVLVIIPVSAKTLLPSPARTPPSVSVQTAVLASANTLPSGRTLGPAPASVPSTASLAPDLFRISRLAERLEGMMGSRGETAKLIGSW